nr:C4-dicarboxylate ABC transporter [Sphaerospermopsis sp. FACHB-1094]
MLTSPGGVHSYCFLLRIGFDELFGDLLFLKCLFSLYMSVFMLTLIFSLRNFPLCQFRVRNVGSISHP